MTASAYDVAKGLVVCHAASHKYSSVALGDAHLGGPQAMLLQLLEPVFAGVGNTPAELVGLVLNQGSKRLEQLVVAVETMTPFDSVTAQVLPHLEECGACRVGLLGLLYALTAGQNEVLALGLGLLPESVLPTFVELYGKTSNS